MLADLSLFYKGLLRTSNDLIPIKKELEIAQLYMEMETSVYKGYKQDKIEMRFMRLMQKHVKELGIMIGIPMKRNTMSKLEKKTVPEKLYFTMD